jgi:ABC-type branched-subunit amino acid transport system ATPase component
VLHGIDLSVLEGEFVCIMGANTVGKSTILRAISRLVPRVSGVLRFGAVDLTACAAHQIPTLGIAHVPEGRQIFPDMMERAAASRCRALRPNSMQVQRCARPIWVIDRHGQRNFESQRRRAT